MIARARPQSQLKIFAICALFALSCGSNANAGDVALKLDRFIKCFKDRIIENISKDYWGTDIVLEEATSTSARVSIRLKDNLGKGWFGTVYSLEPLSVEAASTLGVSPTDEVVLKVPLSASEDRNGNHIFLTRRFIKQELVNYELLKVHIAEIQHDDSYPANAAWSKGSLPVASILGYFHTGQWDFLVKSKIIGRELSKIEKLTPEMKASLLSIFQMAQAISHVVPVKAGKNKTAFYSPDIRPSNLVWIDNPAELKKLGLTRASFYLYELDQFPGNRSHYVGEKRSFAGYLNTVNIYLNKP